MALEAGDGFISGLVITNPVNSTDQVAQGDDHLRLIKTALKGTFPNLNGAVNATPAQLNVLATDGAGAGMLADIAAIADPGADRLLGWDESANAAIAFTIGLGLTTSTTTFQINAAVVPQLGEQNLFTGSAQFISAAAAKLVLIDTAGDTNEKRVEIQAADVAGKAFRIFSADDSGVAGADLLVATRSGTAWSGFTLAATALTFTGAVQTVGTVATEVGTNGVPRVSKTADYTLAAADAGHELVLTSAADDITVQASGAPAAGCIVFLENGTGGSVDIIQGSGMTLTLDGTATTGSRTLAANGRAYVRFTSSSAASVGGLGVA